MIGNDVVLCSGLNVADRHHGHFAGFDFAGHDGLQRENRPGRDHDRINGRMRRGAMPAFAVNRDAHGIRIRVVNAGSDRDHARGQFVAHVQCHSHVRLGKAREQTVADHSIGAADGFLGGLADQHQRSMPGVLAVRHDFGRAENRRHVQIVSAGVHHRNVASGIIFGAHFAGVGKAGFFLNRKRIQFRAQHDGWARSVLEDSDDSCAAHVFGDVISGAAQALRELRGGLRFMR